jgi:hypothetical protein
VNLLSNTRLYKWWYRRYHPQEQIISRRKAPLTPDESLLLALTEKTSSGEITWQREGKNFKETKFSCRLGGVEVLLTHFRGSPSRLVFIGGLEVSGKQYIVHNLYNAAYKSDKDAEIAQLVTQMKRVWEHIKSNAPEEPYVHNG